LAAVPGKLRSQEKKVGKDVGGAMITAAVADAAVLTGLLLLRRNGLRQKP